MIGKLEALLARIPWRMMVAVIGGALAASGVAHLLSVGLPADPGEAARTIKLGMEMLIVGGVVLIAVVMIR